MYAYMYNSIYVYVYTNCVQGKLSCSEITSCGQQTRHCEYRDMGHCVPRVGGPANLGYNCRRLVFSIFFGSLA